LLEPSAQLVVVSRGTEQGEIKIFDFDYQIECYVPEALRQFGYFCLPVMYRDRLVGRIDCKAHRADKFLEIKSLHLDHKVDDDFDELLLEALTAFAAFNLCPRLEPRSAVANDHLRRIAALC
jgi:hypothetical protein